MYFLPKSYLHNCDLYKMKPFRFICPCISYCIARAIKIGVIVTFAIISISLSNKQIVRKNIEKGKFCLTAFHFHKNKRRIKLSQ